MGSVGKASGGGGGAEIPGTDERRRRRNEEPQSLQEFQQMSLKDAADFIKRAFNDDEKYINQFQANAGIQGMNSWNDLQYIIDLLNAHGMPTVLSDKEYDAISLKENAVEGVEVYRGLGYDTTGLYQQQFLFGDKTFIGDGVHGDGIYMTTSIPYANAYSGTDIQEITSVTGFIDKSKAKVITEDALSKMFWSEPSTIRSLFRGNDRIYALYKGYNVIVCPGGNSGDDYAYDKGYDAGTYMDFYLPLTRDVLVMREHTKLRNS